MPVSRFADALEERMDEVARAWLARLSSEGTPLPAVALARAHAHLIGLVAALRGQADADPGELAEQRGRELCECAADLTALFRECDALRDAVLAIAAEPGVAATAEDLRVLIQAFACTAARWAVGYVQAREREARRAIELQLEERERARNEIARREHLLDALFEHLPAGFIVADPSGRFVRMNPELSRILRKPATWVTSIEDYGRAYSGYHPDGRPYLPDEWPLARSLRTGEVVYCEQIEGVRGDGTRLVATISSAPVRDAEGRIVAAVALIEDVTERRRAEIERDRLFNLSPDILCVCGFDAYFRRVNPALTRTLGWTEEELLAAPFIELIHPDDRSATLVELRKLAQGVPMLRFDNRFRHKDGSYRWLSWKSMPIVEEALFVTVGRDVTEQKRGEDAQALLAYAGAALTSSLEYEVTLATVARLAVPSFADWCMVDLVGNDGKLSRVAVAHADPARAPIAAVLRVHPPRYELPEHPSVQALQTGRTVLVREAPPSLLPKIAGEPDHLEALYTLAPRSILAVPLVARGQRLGVLTFVTAESARIFGPEDFVLAEDLCRRAALAVDNARLFREQREHVAFEQRLVGIVSHDLRNPLSAILLATSRLARSDLPPDARAMVARIASSAERATRLIRDLLDFTQSRLGGGIPVRPVPVDVHEFARAVVEEARTSHPQRTIQLTGESDASGLFDPDRLAQVIHNLVDNAIKYGDPDAPVTVRVIGDPDSVCVAVHNRGPTIPPDARAAIFEPMRRAARPQGEGRGVGLGLFIAKLLVHAHGGSIDVRSGDDEGTTFTVRLPRVTRAAPGEDGAAGPPPRAVA